MADAKPKFIRVHGRIVPIRDNGKSPAGKKPLRIAQAKPVASKPKKKKFNIFSTVGFNAFIAGGAIGTLGQFAHLAGQGTSNAALKTASITKGKTLKAAIQTAMKARTVGKFGRRFELLGLGIQVAGLGLAAASYFKYKQRSKK